MKKRIRASRLAPAMALSLALVLSGCGQSNQVTSGSPSPDSTAGTSAPPSQTDLMTPFTPYPETITLTVGRIENKGQPFAAGEDSSDNGMLKLIEKKLNIKFVIEWEAIYDEYMQKLSLCIASGDLPDIFQVVNQNAGITFRSLASNGALADLTEAYEKCLGGLAAEILEPVNKEDYLASCYYDGKLYGITAPADVDNFNLLWVRNDWLEALNLELPQTIEDIETIAKQFIDKDPGGTGDPIGIAINPSAPLDRSNSYYALTTVANALGSFPNSWLKDEAGQLTYGSIAPETKDALEVLARWYESGILDKSFLTYRSVDDVTPFVNNNQIGLLFAGWWEPWIFADMVSKNPGAEWIPVLAPLNSEGQYVHNNPLNPGINGAILVSSACKYPEAVIKAMNVEFDAISGAYDNNSEDVALFKAAKEANSLGRTTSPFGPGRIASNFSRIPTFAETINNYVKTGKVTYDAFNSQDKDYIEGAYQYLQKKDTSDTTGVVGYYGHYLAGNLTQSDKNLDLEEVIIDYTDSMGDLWPAMDALQKQVYIQIITGEKPLDYFDEFVSQWKKMGGDTIINEVNEAYKQ